MGGGGGGRERRRGRTFGGASLALLILLLAAAGWTYLRLDGNLGVFDADGIARDRPGSAAGDNVLVIGSDSRAGGNRDLGGGTGRVGRSDTAFLLHVYGDGERAAVVSIPRDTLVEIPPCRLPDGSWTAARDRAMFNSAFSVGGTAEGNPACTQNTVERLTGLRVDHTVVVDFAGFAALTDAVGGVEVCMPQDVYEGDLDPNRGSRGDLLFTKGRQTVSGRKALDYVRVRHGLGDGSDIGRIRRQQAFVAALIKKVRSRGLDPTALLPLADAATKSLTVDPGLGSVEKLVSFARSLKGIDQGDITFVTMPWRYEGDRVAVVQPEADALWAALREDRAVAGGGSGGSAGDTKGSGDRKGSGDSKGSKGGEGAGVRVSLADATHTDGPAARAAALLRRHGYTVTGPRTVEADDAGTTVIEFGPGQAGRARTLARLFPGAFVRGTADSGISVTLGRDYGTAADGTAAEGTAAEGTAAADASRASTGVSAMRPAADNPCPGLSYG
ncbi:MULTISPECIES: LCP family protein [Streptomyces]|uniref:LCP family protein n=1 Tax=Streptomyces TaxID=1883 RepID=UPI00163D00A1|nr:MULTISPECIES: LCP family protein [Streptomyces]MBC2873561.1 LCP family protein [Streptomyces sp. TYQ1024]UBI36862.1 LCP family protein [Streptomyces mobaraensis]UKW29454.1 LCP family protein [Streptomyces sp. TYQ1024]